MKKYIFFLLILQLFYGCSVNGDSDSVNLDIDIESNEDKNSQIIQSIPPNDVAEMKSLFEMTVNS